MNITLNGQPRVLPESSDLRTVIEQFYQIKNPVVAELNGAIINDPLWKKTLLQEGDTLELIGFVGGGECVE